MNQPNQSNRLRRNPAQKTTVTQVTFTSVSSETPPPPPPHNAAITAAQIATTPQQSPMYASRPNVTRLPSEQRTLQPVTQPAPNQARPPTRESVVSSTPSAISNPPSESVQGATPESPPPALPARNNGNQNNVNNGVAYGYDHRSKSSKEKQGISPSNAFKKIGTFFNNMEPRPEPRNDLAYETKEQKYKRERNEIKSRYRELQDLNDANVLIIQQLSEDLAKEQDRVDRTKRSVNLLETTIDNKEVFLGVQARNDDEVRSKFASLISAIKTWSNNFNTGSANAFKEEFLQDYQRVGPLCTQAQYLDRLVADKKRKRLFVRGWTAYIMTMTLFRTLDPLGEQGRDVWIDGGLADTFSRLENDLWFTDRKVISHRSFNDWRAFTADLLGKVTSGRSRKAEDEAHNTIREAVEDVMEVVRPWCVTSDPNALRGYEDRLYKIFLEAVQLAQFLRTQRALWSIKFPTRPSVPGLPETGLMMFDPACMKDDRGDDEDVGLDTLKQHYVDVVVTPALYKRGNPNGEKFENEEISVPAVVVLKIA